jgi:anti-sigma factor RsiW
MTDETLTETQMRQFFLGQLNESQREQVEEIFICDAETREKILIAEEDLIEDYLDGSLSPEDHQRFRAHYLTSPQQQQKLRITRALRQAEVDEDTQPAGVVTAVRSSPSKLRAFLDLFGLGNRLVAIPVVATLSAVVIAGSIWLYRSQRSNVEEEQRLAIQKELDELNRPSAIAASLEKRGIFSTVVSNITLRSSGKYIKVPAGTAIIELWLMRSGKDTFPSYQVELRNLNSAEKFVIHHLRPETGPQGEAVRIRIPSSLATRDDFRLTLFGITSGGHLETVEEYTLQFEKS